MFAQGFTLGWLATALPVLSSNDSPLLDGPLTNEELSWIGSMSCLGGLCGSSTFGYFISLLGCKNALTFLALPSVTFWAMIYYGKYFYQILAARFVSGYVGGSLQTTLILYMSDIANDKYL